MKDYIYLLNNDPIKFVGKFKTKELAMRKAARDIKDPIFIFRKDLKNLLTAYKSNFYGSKDVNLIFNEINENTNAFEGEI